jgi:5-methylcytosine-specific restriction endonuclease McrA
MTEDEFVNGPIRKGRRLKRGKALLYFFFARDIRVGKKLQREVFERDENRCLRCGSTVSLQADHVYPRTLGGPSTESNLQTLCRVCNNAKSFLWIYDFRPQRRDPLSQRGRDH